MPYHKVSDLPAYVKKRSSKDQRQWLAVWNDVFDKTGSETKAFRSANSAISMHVRMSEPFGPVLIQAFTDAFAHYSPSGVYEVQVCRTGLWKNHPFYGDIHITPDDLYDALMNYRESSRVPFLDYNHGITDGKTIEDQRKAGEVVDFWVRKLDGTVIEPEDIKKTEGVLIYMARYQVTEECNKFIYKKEYNLFSPTFYPSFYNKETGEWQGMTILGGAITNIPYFDGMSGFVPVTDEVEQIVAAFSDPSATDRSVAPKIEDKPGGSGGPGREGRHAPTNNGEGEHMELNLSEFGGPIKASEADVVTTLRTLKEENAKLRKTTEDQSTAVTTLNGQVSALSTGLQELHAKQKANQMDADFKKAYADRKLTPNERKDWEPVYTASGRDAFNKVVASLPVRKDIKFGPDGIEFEEGDHGQPSDAEATILEMAEKVVKEEKVTLDKAIMLVQARNPELSEKQRLESLARTRNYEETGVNG